jgi:hypothetical protein
MKNLTFRFQFAFVLLAVNLSFIGFVSAAHASIRIDVSPIGGGNSLRFGRVDHPSFSNQEVRIRISSDDNQQYQIFQRVQSPLTNERNETLDPRSLLNSSLGGSNGSGTLYLQDSEPMSYSEQLIYTSNETGFNDSFTLVYQINTDEIRSFGNFSGQILYSVRSFADGGEDEVVLNVFFDAGGNLTVETKLTEGDAFQLGTAQSDKKDASLTMLYRNNPGSQVEIYSDWIQPPVNELGQPINPDALQLQLISQTDEELKFQDASKVEKVYKKIYSSTASEDDVQIRLLINEKALALVEAGAFRGTLRFTLKTMSAEKIQDVQLELTVAPIFELVVTLPTEGMSFSHLVPDSPPQMREVNAVVRSNLRKPYQVSQQMVQFLTNENGGKLDAGRFSYRQEIISGEGKVEHEEFSPVEEGQSTLIYSDREGGPIDFRVIYRIEPYPGMDAGNYQTQIVYSLSEI